jgi:VWFA-related protein
MASRREFASLLLAAPAAWAQQQQESLPAGESAQFRTTVDVVVAPVTVLDDDDNLVNGLQPHDFRLFDNGKEQDIRVDVAYVPISLVIAIQASSNVEAILPQVQKIGPMIQPLIIGEQGEVAVMAYDHRFRLMADFTADPNKIAGGLKKITAGGSSVRLNDAVSEAVRMLRSRAPNRRRILLLIGETRDRGSEARARQVLTELQLHNVLLYSVNMSRLVSTIMAKAEPPRPDPLPPAARPLPPNVPATPNTVQQTWGSRGYSAQFIPVFIEIFKATKAIFVDNPMEVYTKASGGAEFAFMTQKGLEDAITAIGTELHSQYLISYNPNNKEDGGFHEIEVRIIGRRNLKVRTRPGYWLGPK